MMDKTLGQIRKVTTPDGCVDYIMEFPKTYGASIAVQNPDGTYSAQPIVTEWEKVSLVDLIHALQR